MKKRFAWMDENGNIYIKKPEALKVIRILYIS